MADPAVSAGLVEPPEVRLEDPVLWFLRMPEVGPLVGEPPQVGIQRIEHLAGHGLFIVDPPGL